MTQANTLVEIDGQRTREARTAAGMPLQALAEKAGISYGTLWRIERGRTRRTMTATRKALESALGKIDLGRQKMAQEESEACH